MSTSRTDGHPSSSPFTGNSRLAGMDSERRCKELCGKRRFGLGMSTLKRRWSQWQGGQIRVGNVIWQPGDPSPPVTKGGDGSACCYEVSKVAPADTIPEARKFHCMYQKHDEEALEEHARKVSGISPGSGSFVWLTIAILWATATAYHKLANEEDLRKSSGPPGGEAGDRGREIFTIITTTEVDTPKDTPRTPRTSSVGTF
ncbi:hypothetical protein DFH94DRAFT_678681 [Russula ochroleuca]|uniref:Uncharacterized protein n=1 Tax=Russula ochroleuca TaxID=152965 RepID=A0A9P5N488_9AGAM|nr:hypothetical protein DFH94DRAFT_678681 [Russula ochroleuca]